MDEQVDGPDQGTSEAEEGVWVASSQSAYVAEVSSAALASSSQDNHYVDSHQLAQDYTNSGQYDHSHYQDLRPTFSGTQGKAIFLLFHRNQDLNATGKK